MRNKSFKLTDPTDRKQILLLLRLGVPLELGTRPGKPRKWVPLQQIDLWIDALTKPEWFDSSEKRRVRRKIDETRSV